MDATSQMPLRELAQRLSLHVAIDGPAGAGKTTIGRALAARLGCPYVDTGLMYRAVTLRALQASVPLHGEAALVTIAGTLTFDLTRGQLTIDGRLPGSELRSALVDAAVSQVSAYPSVRTVLVERQRALARNRCLVMVGRDIATVVLPSAPVKLWVTASAEERARRRADEHAADGLSLEQVAADIELRDHRDGSRAVSPSVPAPDAVVLPTDGRSEAESVNEALEIVIAIACRLDDISGLDSGG